MMPAKQGLARSRGSPVTPAGEAGLTESIKAPGAASDPLLADEHCNVSRCVGDPDASISNHSDEVASRPLNTSAMAAPMRSAAASVSRSPTWA